MPMSEQNQDMIDILAKVLKKSHKVGLSDNPALYFARLGAMARLEESISLMEGLCAVEYRPDLREILPTLIQLEFKYRENE